MTPCLGGFPSRAPNSERVTGMQRIGILLFDDVEELDAVGPWASLDLLAELDPTIEVRRDDRFVDDGEVVTSAGVSAGIDMALHVLARLGGRERAKEIRRYIQYDPLPPVQVLCHWCPPFGTSEPTPKGGG
jgi:hypothetical protein